MSDFFNKAPGAPMLAGYTPPSINSALGQFLGQQPQLGALQGFANQVNQGSNTAYQNMLYGTSPTLQGNMAQFGQNTQSLLNGQIPADVAAQTQNSAAYQSLMGGFGGSNMAHALTARDLGQTSLSLQQQGAQNLGQQQGMAQALNPTNMNTTSLFYSPQTILSRDDQSALINQQIQNQNSMIGYQNQLQSDKGSPFQQMLTNNMASMLGMATNPMTALSTVMSAEGGSYNPSSANPGNSQGFWAMTPGSPDGSGGGGTPEFVQGGGGGSQSSGGGGGGGGAGLGGIMGMASMCCFIFLESNHGNLPWWVRECRDEFAPESTSRRIGYIRMANWLVPAMRKSVVVRSTVNVLMVKPLTLWGGWYKKVKGYEWCWIFRPVVDFWFNIWTLMGGK